ncbi:hypothetical protein GCM10017688_54780 [Streptomyces ramulosus]
MAAGFDDVIRGAIETGRTRTGPAREPQPGARTGLGSPSRCVAAEPPDHSAVAYGPTASGHAEKRGGAGRFRPIGGHIGAGATAQAAAGKDWMRSLPLLPNLFNSRVF